VDRNGKEGALMGGGSPATQTTQQNQNQNSSFSQLSNMIENMATQGLTNTQQSGTSVGSTTGAQNQSTAGTSAGTGQTASTYNPWAPAVPSLTNLIGAIGGQGYGLTPEQQAALANMNTSATAIPNFGAQGSNTVSNLFGSTNGIPQAGMVGDAYNTYKQTIAPYLNSNYTNPMSNPVLNQAIFDPISGLNKQISTGIASEFAGAGRDPAGNADASKAIAAGESQADLPLLLNQYNTNVGTQLGALSGLQSTAGSAANTEAQLNQLPFMNQIAALQQAGQLPGLYTAPAAAQYGAANTQFGAPFSNINIPLGMLSGVAGLGGSQAGTSAQTGATTGTLAGTSAGTSAQAQQQQGLTEEQKLATGQTQGSSSGTQQGSSSGSSTSTMTPASNPWTTAAGIGLGLFSLSDERTKENIEPVGLLNNGLNVYRYNFRGDTRPQIGLIAQEVERVKPEAVADVGGLKMVNYRAATEPGLWRQAA
jgi:hypothetical protein